MVTKKEAYKLLYKFLKEQGLLNKYCHNVLEEKRRYFGTHFTPNAKNILLTILDRELGTYSPYDMLLNTYGTSINGFRWCNSAEGHAFWEDVLHRKWYLFLKKHSLSEEFIERD